MATQLQYCDFYSQMSYQDFIEFQKQNDENAQYEISNQHERRKP